MKTKIMTGKSVNLDDSVVVSGASLPWFFSLYNEFISAIDFVEIKGERFFAVIGNGMLTGNITSYDMHFTVVANEISRYRYFNYLNSYQIEMSEKIFTLTAISGDFGGEIIREITGTPKELLSSLDALEGCFSISDSNRTLLENSSHLYAVDLLNDLGGYL